MQENSRYLTVYTEESPEAETSILDKILALNGVPEAYLDDPMEVDYIEPIWADADWCPACGCYHS